MLLMLLTGSYGADWSGEQLSGAPSPPPVVEETPEPEVYAYRTPLPEVDIAAQVLLESAPGQSFDCTVEALIDPYGQLLDAVAPECPVALRNSAITAVRQWEFHPPTLDSKAVRGHLTTRFVFVSNTVLSEVPTAENVHLVRVAPTATPQWPKPPRPGTPGRRLMRDLGVDQVSCTLDLSVDELGLPVGIEPVSCPEDLQVRTIRRLQRYGLEVEGASLGDGTRFRLELWFP